ncbi:hypothetical protein EW026_g8259 [Hermanssonia centrifuga]|uniref:Uncharacterized protein n=1 Tax=Hermanssonia centrifuga TaxID=98765 RepID=A0A4V6S0T1_9APHY|nr:hypothetical protein EW026_g8259 [Hermanssonia centrifuga]
MCQHLCRTDLMVLQIGDLCIINCYLPPDGSRWYKTALIPPDELLAEVIAACCGDMDRQVLLAGDLNARTASAACSPSHLTRASPDDGPITGHGRFLLQLGGDYDLQILNGSLRQKSCTIPYFTSFQHNGTSVIDYMLVSPALLRQDPPLLFEVEIHHKKWSDHAAVNICLSIEISGPSEDVLQQGCPSDTPRNHFTLEKGTGTLDTLLRNTLQSERSLEEALQRLYGDVYVSTPRVIVHTDGSCNQPGSVHATAGAGVYWGPFDPRNVTCRVPGKQTNNRGELYAILKALLAANPYTSLYIFTDSQYAIHCICHWAPAWESTGWTCANADILQDIVMLIAQRPADLHLQWVKGHDGNLGNEMADREAGLAARLPGKALPYQPLRPPSWPSLANSPALPSVSKVFTSLPRIALRRETTVPVPVRLRDSGLTDQSDLDHEWKLQNERVQTILAAKQEGTFWTIFRGWTDPKPRSAKVTADQLREVFLPRMNPPVSLPPAFDSARHAVNHFWASHLPDRTHDSSRAASFSRAITLEEIAAVKNHIRKHTINSAKGADRIGYNTILNIDNEELRVLYQSCIDNCDAPTEWLTSYLAAIGKRGKDLSDPSNYRTIGLESCLVKFLTLLIDRWVREWAETHDKLPPSQNGFRAHFRTNNNAFILRSAIEKAAANGDTVYAAFVDLSNAFPSVDQPTLWRKLKDWGVSGPLIDWLRMLYARMTYVVSFGGEFAKSFSAFAGILIGDPASPILWNLYLADFSLPVDASDITLGGEPISHLEQADDIVLFSTTIAGLQRKLNQLAHWCGINFMTINADKSKFMIFNGPLPRLPPTLFLNGKVLQLVSEYCYVGVTFRSTDRFIFGKHLQVRAKKARTAANAVLSLEAYTGHLPAWAARSLYMARVDPHLIFASEVILDVDGPLLESMRSIQHAYIRRMLGLNKRSTLAVLFTETGLWPIRYRRVFLALQYLAYILRKRPLLTLLALQESVTLYLNGKASWTSDLLHVLRRLPVPVLVPSLERWSPELVQCLRAASV